MAKVYVNIGSNLGKKQENIKLAIKKIENKFGVCRKSELVESAPWGFDSTNSFLNIGITFDTLLSPKEVLAELQKIEKEISPLSHRDGLGNYVDRLIDIDIMAIDDKIVNEPDLIIPHCHLFEREFFLEPFRQLNPDLLNRLQKIANSC